MGTALHLQALLRAVASSHAVVDRWERHGKRRSVRLQLSGAAFALQGTGSALPWCLGAHGAFAIVFFEQQVWQAARR